MTIGEHEEYTLSEWFGSKAVFDSHDELRLTDDSDGQIKLFEEEQKKLYELLKERFE